MSWNPRVFIYHNFLSDAECRHIKRTAAPMVGGAGVCVQSVRGVWRLLVVLVVSSAPSEMEGGRRPRQPVGWTRPLEVFCTPHEHAVTRTRMGDTGNGLALHWFTPARMAALLRPSP